MGAIDVGTNSVHLLVAEVSPEGQVTVVEKARDQVELGSGGLERHTITPEAFARGLAALEGLARACDSLGVEDVHCAATSAVREAENGTEFCRVVKERTGLHVRRISGREEARLIYLGARGDLDFSRGRVLLFDLGGGSTEIILCDAEQPLVVESLPLGHIRLADRFHRADPFGRDEREALAAQVREVLAPLGRRIRSDDFAQVVGTSGAVRTLALMASLARGESPSHEQGLVLERSGLQTLLEHFHTLRAGELDALPGMDPRRRHTLPAAAVVVREILDLFGKERLLTSDRSLRDGLVVDWVLRHRPEVDLSGMVPDPRRRSVLALMERYGVDRPHAELVAGFALRLFDATAEVHELRILDRRLLEFAALLHDVGHHIDGRDHNKHGAYLIQHTRMAGFTAPEIAILSLLVRYHRGGTPKTRHPEFAALREPDRRRVRILAALLRVADALDRGHQQNVEELRIELDDERLLLRGTTREEPDLERWATVQRCDLIRKVLGREARVEMQRRRGPS